MLEMAPLAAFAGLLALAAGFDVATMTIPNWVSIALAALFVPAALAAGMPAGAIAIHLAFATAVLGVGFGLFVLGVFGGGDAKLIAAAALWTGLSAFAGFALWTAIAGGALALALMLARAKFKPRDSRPAFLNRLLRARGGVPYGVAIMIGGVAVVDALPFVSAALTLP